MIRKKQNKTGISYEASVKIGGRRIYQRFVAYREAERWVDSVRYKRDVGIPICSRVSVNMLFDAYLDSVNNKGNAISGTKKSISMFKNHVEPFYKDHDLKTVTIEEHGALLSEVRAKGLTPAMSNRVRSLMHTMFSIALKKRLFSGAFTFNPFSCLEPAREVRKVVDYWNMDSLNRFLESEKDSHYYPLWVLLLNTGLRIGEAIAIHRNQIDTTTDILTVSRTWCQATYSFRLATKGRRIRYVGLNEAVQDTLYPFLKNDLVFVKPDGSHLSIDHLGKVILPEACKKAGVSNIGCHGFRHSFSANYLMKGGSLWDLQKILGHSSIKTTEEHYAHFNKEHITKRAKVFSIGEKIIKINFAGGVA